MRHSCLRIVGVIVWVLSALVAQAGFIHADVDSWTNRPSLPQAQEWLGVADVKGRLSAVGGNNDIDTPPDGVWTDTPHGAEKRIPSRLGVVRE